MWRRQGWSLAVHGLRLSLLALCGCSLVARVELEAPTSVFGDADSGGDGADSSTTAEVALNPAIVDLGTVYRGCPSEASASLSNNSGSSAEILEIVADDEQVTVALDGETLPYTLVPDESVNLLITVNGANAGEIQTQISVVLGYQGSLSSGIVKADVHEGPSYAEGWTVPDDFPTDLLFVIDQSCSMDDDKLRLVTRFGQFVTALESFSTDWQITVANDDDGCTNSGIMTPATPNLETTFGLAADSGGGIYTEALLTVARNALSQSVYGGCNAGMVRDGAMLHIIAISDEEEQSEAAGESWSDLVAEIVDAKGDAELVTISAVASPVPDGCEEYLPGTGYDQAVAETGGVFLSICEDWANAVAFRSLSEASINRTRYLLQAPPLESTIQVTVEGTATQSWSYDSSNQVLELDEPLPVRGETVRIEYETSITCE